MRIFSLFLLLSTALLVGIGLGACASKLTPKDTSVPTSKSAPDAIPPPNEVERLEPLSFGNEGFPKLQKFYKNGGPKAGVKIDAKAAVLDRVEADFNGDGRVDFVQIYNSTGEWVEKEKADLDGDGILETTYTYAWDPVQKAPQLVLQEFDSHLSGHTSVWKYYRDGKLIKREVDRQNTGRPDYWEYYENNRLLRVDRDDNLDGRPDFQPRLRQIVKPTAKPGPSNP